MRKIFWFFALFLMLGSCGKKGNADQSDQGVIAEFSGKTLPVKIALNSKTKTIMEEWPEYNAMDISFDALYKAENKEDLRLVIEDLMEKQKLLAGSNFPEEFNIPQIESRQKVFRTYALKVRSDLEYGTDVTPSVKEMVEAYNAVRNQFNVIVDNTLDTKLILDE